MTFPR
jgi:flavin-binding protein dodecin